MILSGVWFICVDMIAMRFKLRISGQVWMILPLKYCRHNVNNIMS